jgi:hypothetical protein
MRRWLFTLHVAVALFALVATTAVAAPGVPYTIHGAEQLTFEEEGFCSPSATITVDAKFVVHVNAAEEGLTDEEILEALFSGDPEGILLSLTFTETGTFTALESTGQIITGRFTVRFGGNVNHNGDTLAFSATFSVNGVDQESNHIVVQENSQVTLVDGEPIVEFERFTVRGCP